MSRESVNSLEIARELILRCVPAGGCVVDATAGGGRDTVFLAKTVGPQGKVWAFDIQQEALAATADLLASAKLSARVQLIHDGHQNLKRYLRGSLIHAAMFNLGYLPGGNKELITLPENTLKALGAALELLVPGGLVTLVVYTGHPGGKAEGAAVEAFVQDLSQALLDVFKVSYPNREASAPYLIAIQKR